MHRLADRVETVVEEPAERHHVAAAPVTPGPASTPAGHPLEVAAAPRAEVTDKQAVEQTPADTAPPVSPLVICGDRKVYVLRAPHADTGDEVTDEQPERLSTAAARVVLESCWAKGTPPAEAARLATRSTSYAKKVYARLDETRGHAPVPGQLALAAGGGEGR
ncbi:hypothetical protein OG946_20700 [Streptomyces sp. NBC_01808]|uniref:hypothetical protein n=1 Tax=Streptomyces sp. NBC_01808 TaxID=2975947 RepID=UPI002DD9702C|nr:hypothetical protein [Streptomyces sp. NBC_01808]WSA39569.1 hypothetical protein OG946_20700 [Streptomyces sp. NBC_01808]